MINQTKICNECKIEKELNYFYFDKKKKSHRGKCKICSGNRDNKRWLKLTTNNENIECYKCKIIKNTKEFYKNRFCCKQCDKIQANNYCKNNYEKVKRARNKYSKEYRQRDYVKEKRKLEAQKYKEKSGDKQKKRAREYYKKNKEEIRERHREWYKKNKESKAKKDKIKRSTEEWKEKNRKYQKERRKNNPQYKIRMNCARRIRDFLSGRIKSLSTQELLGCKVDFLKEYLESLFQPGMSWDNYGGGDYNKNHWHIDHIIPCVAFDLTKEEEQLKCFHYSNLQPLWWQDNLSKNDKY